MDKKMLRPLLAAGALFASQAIAQPFYFEQQAGFQNFVANEAGLIGVLSGALPFNDDAGPGPSDRYPMGVMDTLSWEFGPTDPGDPSSLSITTYNDSALVRGGLGGISPSSGVFSQNGFDVEDTNMNGLWESSEWFTITRLIHDNYEISGFSMNLWSMQAIANLEIFSDAAHNNRVFFDQGSINDFLFNESHNDAPCDETPNPHGTVCDDSYMTPLVGFAPLLFDHMGMTYRLDFRVISPDNSAIIMMDGMDLMVFTAEDFPGQSILDVQMHFEKVPEPEMLALMTLGLSGLGLALRRRRRQ